MSELNVIKSNLLSLVKTGTLPQIKWKSNTSINALALQVTGHESTLATESESSKIGRWFDEVVAELAEVDNGSLPKDFDGVTFSNSVFVGIEEAITSVVVDVDGSLSTIKESVTALKGKFEEVKNRAIQASPTLTAYTKHTDNVVEFEKFPWENLNPLGSVSALTDFVEQDLALVKDLQGVSAPTIHFKRVLGNAMEKVGLSKVDTVEVPKDVKETILATINEKEPDLTIDALNRWLTIALNATSIKRAIASAKMRTEKELTATCIEFLNNVFEYRKFQKVMNRCIDDTSLSEGSKKSLEKNMEVLSNLHDVEGYFVAYHRHNTFKETVMFNNGMVNGDLEKERVAEGVQDIEMVHHKSFYYKNTPMPSRGITLQSVLARRDHIKGEMERTNAATEIRCKVELNKVCQEAFVQTIRPYMEQMVQEERIEVPATGIQKTAEHKAGYLINKSMTPEDLLYHCIITMQYSDSLVASVYDKIGLEYIKLLDEKKELSIVDILATDVRCYSEMVSDFLCKRFTR